MASLPNGFTPQMVQSGPVPNLNLYNLMTAGAATMKVELFDGTGATICEGTLTLSGAQAAATLSSLIEGISAGALAAWPNAAGMHISVSSGTFYYNRSGNTGGTPNIAPTSSSIGTWVSGTVYAIGLVA